MKPIILLLHGALGSKNQFKSLKSLLGSDFDVYDFSFDGHGGVPIDSDYSIELFTNNTLQFIKENNLKKVHVFGYSMGGYVALNLALQYPDLIDKIVTLGTKFNWDKESTQKEVRMLDPEKIKEKVPRFAAKLEQDHAPLDWEVVVTKTAKMMIELSEGKNISQDHLTQIPHQVVIGIGTNDQMVTHTESEEVSHLIPNGSLVSLEEAPHPIDKVNPEALILFIKNALL